MICRGVDEGQRASKGLEGVAGLLYKEQWAREDGADGGPLHT